jgi:hypothetical protein
MSDAVYTLVKSLNKSEKRHFKLFSSKHVKGEKNNYVRFFDALEKQKEYDESALRKTEKYISNFSTIKVRLYGAILKSLKAYNANSSLKNKLKGEVDFAEILIAKGLLVQAKKIIRQIKRKAKKYELTVVLLEALRLETIVMGHENYRYNSLSDVKNCYTKIRETLNLQLEINANELFNSMAFATLRKSGHPNTDQKVQYYKKAIKPYYIKSEKGLNFLALLRHYDAKAISSFATNDPSAPAAFYDKKIKLMEKHLHYINNNLRQYAITIYQSILQHITQRHFSPELFVNINKLKRIKFKSEFEQKQFSIMAYLLELCTYCLTGEFDKGTSLVSKIKKTGMLHLDNANNYSETINVSLYYFIAYTYFGKGDYQQSNNYLNAILNYNSPVTIGFNRTSKVLSLIVEFEMKKLDKLEYSIKSTYRYLSKADGASKVEMLLLGFLKKQLKEQPAEQELLLSFKKLKAALEKLKNDRFEKNIFIDFDYISWLGSKIERKPFAEIVKEQAAKLRPVLK